MLRITNTKRNLSKTIDLDKYTIAQIQQITKVYENAGYEVVSVF